MTIRWAGLLASTLGTLCWTAALAQTSGPADGPYLRLEGGWSQPNTMGASGVGTLSFDVAPDDGFIAGGAAGFRWKPLRFELGVDVTRYAVSSANYANDAGLGAAAGIGSLNGRTVSLTGSAQNIAVMLNGFYDVPTGTRFDPYVGVGIGFTAFALDHLTTSGLAANTLLINSGQRAFAYQPMVGLDYVITDHVSVGIGYRYFSSVDVSLRDAAGHNFLLHNASHNLLVGLTYQFGTPEAPPPQAAAPVAPPPVAHAVQSPSPAAAPAPIARPAPRSFLVFFAFDKATLTDAGSRTIDEAIAAYNRDKSTAIEVTGYTDLVGSQNYNLDLSRRRAMSVYNYMISKGMPAREIGIDWRGREDPRLPTPGPEPQNRRVEIVMP